MKTFNVQPNQRWYYKDMFQELVVEMLLFQSKYGNDIFWKGRIVQVIKNGGRHLNEIGSWNLNHGVWNYLPGQDSI
jgi:hypothetical protein